MVYDYKGPYDDIIDMPHHVSKTHKHMSLYDRAAQFAPFSALTGYEDAIDIVAETHKVEEEIIHTEAEMTS